MAGNTITAMLDAARHGDEAAAERLLDRVYGELRALARARLRGEKHADSPEAADGRRGLARA